MSEIDARISLQLKVSIPKLRRFARALTGSQSFADTCVVQLMEDILTDLDQIDPSSNLNVDLYRRLNDIVASTGSEFGEARTSYPITSLSRKAYWLTAVEGFSADLAAEVLRIGADELPSILSSVRMEISRGKKAKILIIEDEMFIAADLEDIATSLGHVVVGIARTADESVALFRLHQADLILSDVQLADGSCGTDAVFRICQMTDTPAIFITAYQERFLTGKQAEPTYLIAKPFKLEAVKATISQALYLNDHSSTERVPQYAE